MKQPVNVVFVLTSWRGMQDHETKEKAKFRKLVDLCSGKLRVLNGLEAIESSVSGSD